MKPAKLIIIFWCVTMLYSPAIASPAVDQKAHAEWWLWNYGDYAKTKGQSDPRVAQALVVFDRVSRAADKTSNSLPRLAIINAKVMDVRCLPDGSVIINPKVLDICYNGIEAAIGDARLAFLLGHELAHLANDDDFIKQVKKDSEGKDTSSSGNGDQPGELAADVKGAMYAAMAGFDIQAIFQTQNNFFQFWTQMTGVTHPGTKKRAAHPPIQIRAKFVRHHMQKVFDRYELFHTGLILYHVRSFLDASSTFREFAKIYPGREVFNNIGSCYLRLALDKIRNEYRDDFYRFRLNTAVDYTSNAENMEPRGVTDYLKDEYISDYLGKAERNFVQAAGRDKSDASCRYNLSAVLILKREYARAQAICDEILAIHPKDPAALNNKAVSFYYYGKAENLDTAQKSITEILTALKTDPHNIELNFNLAALKQLLNRKTGAKHFWQTYIAIPNLPRDNFYDYAFFQLYGKLPPERTLAKKTTDLPKIPAGITLGVETRDLLKKWQNMSVHSFIVGKGEEHDRWFIDLKVLRHQNLRLIILDDMVEFIEQTLPSDHPITPTQLLKNLGPPQRTIPFKNGRFNVYTYLGFTFTEIEGKTHTYIWYEPH